VNLEKVQSLSKWKFYKKNGGYKRDELLEFKAIIFSNLITQMRVLSTAALKTNITFTKFESKAKAEKLLNAEIEWNNEISKDIADLWSDGGIQEIYSKSDRQFVLNDSASYFFDNIQRISASDYLPNEDDVLRARVRSTGIEEAFFIFDNLAFRMIDVGGQRNERRKWIHCFDEVTAVIFCAALSEYDQKLREDDTQNRMMESLLLFEDIVNCPPFKAIPFIIFLNKTDLFREKLEKVPLNTLFTDYTGGAEFDKACDFVKSKFILQIRGEKSVYPHYTCAVSTENIKTVFKDVRDTLLKTLLGGVFWL